MSARWYRAYEGTVTDAKLGEVALVAGCSRSVAIAAWHSILESAATANDGGKFDVTPRRVAVILCEPPAIVEAVFSELEALGMIYAGCVAAWKRRQFESDTSTERSRKHRERSRNADATLQDRRATPPDTDTDTDTEELPPSLPSEVRPPTPAERGSFLDPGWVPSSAAMDFAATELGGQMAASRTLEKFRNYWLSKSGKDGRKRDWDRTWRNWVMTETDRGGRHGKRTDGGSGSAQRGPTKSELNRAAMVEILTGRADSRLSAAPPSPRWADGGPEDPRGG